MAEPREAMGATERILQGEGNNAQRDTRSNVSGEYEHQSAGKDYIRAKSRYVVKPRGHGNESAEILYKVAPSGGGDRASAANETVDPRVTPSTLATSPKERKTYLTALLESSKSVDRNSKFDKSAISRGNTPPNSYLVGQEHENVSIKSFPPFHVHGDRGTGNQATIRVYQPIGAVGTHVSDPSIPGRQQNSRYSRKGVRNALGEKGGNNTTVRRSGKRDSPSRRGTTPSQTPGPGIPATLQRRSRDDGISIGDTKCDKEIKNYLDPEVLFCKFLEDVPHEKVRHTITRSRRTSRVAQGEELKLPLHVKKGIPNIELGDVKEMMNNQTRQRFEDTWSKLTALPESPSPAPKSKSFLNTRDITELVDASFISKVSREQEAKSPTMEYVVPFTVVEPAENGAERRRFIAWTQSDNVRVKETYKPHVPVKHAAFYLHRARQQSAVKRDLACGFFQVNIPAASRAKFRFTNQDGVLYQMNVMPMGHRCAPELMHTITSTIAGDPNYCTRKSAFVHPGLDVYIDGIRYAADDQVTKKYAEFIDARALKVNALFKDVGTPPLQNYTFNGVNYHHRLGKVALGPKITKRLQLDDYMNGTYSGLEAGVGRLIFGSAVMGIGIPQYHMQLKIVRRRINNLNRDPTLGDKLVPLPFGVRRTLCEWRDALIHRSPVEPVRHPDTVPHCHILCTDASSTGWGAVLYLDYGQVCCTGASWPVGFDYEVNRAETRAVRLAFQKYGHFFNRDTCVDLFVDNTSCLAAINRRMSRSDGITAELCGLLKFLQRNGIAVQARYITSKDNPADPYSRL